jgi:hypothetical protein
MADLPCGPQLDALLDFLANARPLRRHLLGLRVQRPSCVSASAIGPEEIGLLTMPYPAHVIAYHYVTHGRVLLQIANQEPHSQCQGQQANVTARARA